MFFGSKLTSNRRFLDGIILILRTLDHGAEIWLDIVNLELDGSGRLVLVLQQIVLLDLITLPARILKECLVGNLLRRHPVGLVHLRVLVLHIETGESFHLTLTLLLSECYDVQKLLISLELFPRIVLVHRVDLGGLFRWVNDIVELQNIFIIIVVDFEDLERPVRKIFLLVVLLLFSLGNFGLIFIILNLKVRLMMIILIGGSILILLIISIHLLGRVPASIAAKTLIFLFDHFGYLVLHGAH